MGNFQKEICEIQQIGRSTREQLIHPERCAALRHYGITLAGLSWAKNEFRFARHHPGMCQVLVSFRGRGRVHVDGAWKWCHPGNAYITPADTFHAYQSQGQWEVGWVKLEHTPPNLVQPVLREVDPRPLGHVLHGLYQETTTPSDSSFMERWAELLHGYLQRILTMENPARLWSLWNTVQRDLTYPWNLCRLAQHAKMNVEYLRRISLQEVGCSPMKYVTSLRMQHAMALLGNGEKMESVAHAVGYENHFAFSVAFKRMMGRTPRDCRRNGL